MEVWVGMGSNLGDRLSLLQFSLGHLRRLGSVQRLSGIYETEPWGRPDQPAFLNAVCSLIPLVEDPALFLAELKALEILAGRDPDAPRWGPRTLDLDLLFWGHLVYKTDRLTIPHPSLSERRFVLVPMAEVAPDLIPPGTGLTVKQLLDACPDHSSVRFFGNFLSDKDDLSQS